jgi:hypothetical protein
MFTDQRLHSHRHRVELLGREASVGEEREMYEYYWTTGMRLLHRG